MSIRDHIVRMRAAVMAHAGPHVPRWVDGWTFPALEPPASRAAIEGLERVWGERLPRQLVELYEFTNGGYICNEGWISAERVGSFALEQELILRRVVEESDPQHLLLSPGRQLRALECGGGQTQNLWVEVDSDAGPGRVFAVNMEAFDGPDFEADLWRLVGHDLESYFSCLADFAELGEFGIESLWNPHGGPLQPHLTMLSRWSVPDAKYPEYQSPEGLALLKKYDIEYFV